jgi:ribonucleoside-diphosphate reductase alpha chain
MIPFESFEAHMVSQQIAAHIDAESLRASRDLAIELGEPEWCVGTGLRNTHRIAIPPTK